ncbi:MAG: 50S ribosomal protein L24 [Planctomycetota bacterium]|nr:50S ribosomal protein L24 [Planctomycetota bacterium]
MHIKVDDTVHVIAGNDRGKQGRVLSIDRASGKLVVEGCNRVYKHVRRSQKNPQGGRLSKEMPLQMSNVLLLCGKCGVGVRTGARFANDGSKERFCRKCGNALGQIAPAKEKQAAK